MAAGCGYWWKTFDGVVCRCQKAEHAVGTFHIDGPEIKQKTKDETPGETG